MDLLAEKKLPSGETLRVLHWCPPGKVPRKYADYVSASFGSDHPHANFYTTNGWRSYLFDAMDGVYFPEVTDHWFFAEVDGECAGRVWFAWSGRSLRGNFGHVMTEPQYRRKGIMTELMTHCMAEIRRAPVRMLCCATGNKVAAASYVKSGFRLIYGGETGPLCFSKGESLFEESKKIFSGSRITEVRPGTIGDQFDCDKFLAYTPEMWKRPLPSQFGPAACVSDFRLALQESFGGRAVVYTALNEKRECCGYAFAVMFPRMPVLDFVVHPAYMGDAAGLIRRTAESFREKFGVMPLWYGFAEDREKLRAAQAAGLVPAAEIPGGIFSGGRFADLTVMHF